VYKPNTSASVNARLNIAKSSIRPSNLPSPVPVAPRLRTLVVTPPEYEPVCVVLTPFTKMDCVVPFLTTQI